MPTEAALQRAEHRARQPAKIPFLRVAVLDIVGNAIRKDVFDPNLVDAEAMPFEKRAALTACVSVGDRAAGLRLRVPGDKFLKFPESAMAFGKQNPSMPPRN